MDWTPFILILGGMFATSWLLERLAKRAPLVGQSISTTVKVASLFGFFVGILLLVTAGSVWVADAWDMGTRFLLVFSGLALFLKPLKDVPWAALVGLIAGGICVGLVYLLFPLPETVLGVSSTWAYAAIFFIPALLAFMVFKFIEDVFKLVSMIVTSRPVALILGLVCIVQGVLLLVNTSLFTLIVF